MSKPRSNSDVGQTVEGWLKKKSLLGWSNRFFQLRGPRLHFSHDETAASAKVLSLHGLQLYPSNKPLSLSLVGADGKTVLTVVADTQADCARWEQALRAATGTEAGSGGQVVPISAANDDYTKLYLIGKGSFGKVVKVRSNKDGKIYAMKVMYKDMVVEKRLVSVVMSETNLLRKLHHPFIIGMHESFQTDLQLVFILDFHSGGSLAQHVERWGGIGEEMGRFYAAEICLALIYLHSQNVMHRDLKLSNILLDRFGHTILTDFGTAKQQLTARTFCGTPLCMAPEVINHQPYSLAVDWWSYGIILYQMLHGKDPFQGPTREVLYQCILNNPIPFPNPRLSEHVRMLISGLTKKDPAQRYGGNHVQASPWFASMDWAALERKEVPPPWVPDKEYVHKMKDKNNSIHHPPSGPGADSFEGFAFSRNGAAP